MSNIKKVINNLWVSGTVHGTDGLIYSNQDTDIRYALSGHSFTSSHADVSLLSPVQSGHVISFNGTEWVNAVGTGGSVDLEGLTDTNIGTLSSGHLLSYNGTEWVNADPTPILGGHRQEQFTATDSYIFNHNLNAYPQIQVVDNSFNKIETDWTHTSINSTTLLFNGTITNGWVYADLGGAPSGFLQPSGYQVPSGNYVTTEQGHSLWAASGTSIQFTATDEYTFYHTMGFYPMVQIFDSGLTQIGLDIQQTSVSGITLYFNGTLTNAIAMLR